MHRRLTLAVALLVPLAGCGEAEPPASTAPPPAAVATSGPAPALRPPPCPSGSGNCERASGLIAYVERVDPDGDGDAHFVLISDESITAPGVSVIDVRAGLRPSPLPRPGDVLAASGPVYEGSIGQRQIEADRVAVTRRR